MLHLTVAFPGAGKRRYFDLPEGVTLTELRRSACEIFRLGFLRLIAPNCVLLTDPHSTLKDAGLKDGDHITALVLPISIATNGLAFAVSSTASTAIVDWGYPPHWCEEGVLETAIPTCHSNVECLTGNFEYGFAAILSDGSVVTWGCAFCEENIQADPLQLCGVQSIQTNPVAFAAIKQDGSVVTWGEKDFGGDSSSIQQELYNVQEVQAAEMAFAAIRADGTSRDVGIAQVRRGQFTRPSPPQGSAGHSINTVCFRSHTCKR